MKAVTKRRIDRLTPQEEKDVEQSLKEIKEEKGRTVKNANDLIEEIQTN
jgi:hypothetical protein